MRSPIRSAARMLALVAFVLSNASCKDNPFTPQELSAQQISQLEQMLGAISAHLDDIDAKIDAQSAAIDSLQSSLGGGAGGGDTTSVSGALATLESRTDSIMALASYLAVDASTLGFEVCGAVELAGELEYSSKVEAIGRAAGDLGAWAGTGAFAGLAANLKANLDGKVKVGVPFSIGGCLPLGAGDPPVRAAPSGPMARSPQADAFTTTLQNLSGQFNLDEGTLPQVLSNVATVIQSPGSLQLQSVGSQLPLPPALASFASDPVGTVSGRFQELSNQAVDMLCGGTNWGTNVSSVINDACALFPGGLPNVTAFASMSTQFPALQTVVSNVCTRMDWIGARSLVIPPYSVNFGGVLGTWQVFPGYNQALFPAYASPC